MISSLKPSDYGYYQCRAQSVRGVDTSTRTFYTVEAQAATVTLDEKHVTLDYQAPDYTVSGRVTGCSGQTKVTLETPMGIKMGMFLISYRN